MKRAVWFAGCCLVLGVIPIFAECPSADLTGDCIVDMADLEVIARQWLTGSRLRDDLVIVPAGTFQMGDSKGEEYMEERPVHMVSVDSFGMGKCEITNGQYCNFLNSAIILGLIIVIDGVVYQSDTGISYPYCDTSTSDPFSQIKYSGGIFSARTKGDKDMTHHPMVQVSWYGAVAYCNWRSQQDKKEICYDLSTWNCDFTKKGYRLPTEAEWEYAARGGLVGNRFPWGDTITHNQANYNSYWENGKPYSSYDLNPIEGYHPDWEDGLLFPYSSLVGSFPANTYGLYDMAGNVWEWCHDWYAGYASGFQTNPTGPATGTYRICRGGGWGDYAILCRVSFRTYDAPDGRDFRSGFRVVLGL